MCRKFQSSFLAVALLACLILVLSAEAQLNFSTGWGKRFLPMRDGRITSSQQEKPSLEQLLALYNLMQNEAQKLMACQKMTK